MAGMANTFGTTTQQFPLVDPRETRDHRERFHRDLFAELCLANSYYEMGGKYPDVGWLLIDRRSYNYLQNKYASNFKLVIGDFLNAPISFSNLSIVQARCVTRGTAADVNAIYLVQVTNNIGVLTNPWFSKLVNKQYNVCAPAYDTQYYSTTMNGAVAWTWSTMLGNLWSAAGILGTYPGLPSVPLGTPENFCFVGVPVWEAICTVLDLLGMTVIGSYPNFTIVSDGAADTAFTALQTKYAPMLEDDMEYLDTGSGRVPGSVTVYFHRRNQIYGTEETVRRDSAQWQGTSAYPVTISAPAQFSQATGVAGVWDDFTVRYDADGTPLAADTATAALIAAERVQQFYNRIYDGTHGFMRQTYAGAVPFSTGSLVDGVKWSNTGFMSGKKEYAGWRTEIARGFVWEEATLSPILPPSLRFPGSD